MAYHNFLLNIPQAGTPPNIEEQRCFPFGPLYSLYIRKKFNFGQSIWDKSAVLLGNLKITPWKTRWEHIGNRKKNKRRSLSSSSSSSCPSPNPKEKKNWAFLHICQDFSLLAWNFSLKNDLSPFSTFFSLT